MIQVDDEPSMTATIRQALEAIGHEILAVERDDVLAGELTAGGAPVTAEDLQMAGSMAVMLRLPVLLPLLLL